MGLSPQPSSWQVWMAGSRAAMRVDRWLALADGVAALITAVVVVGTFVGVGPVGDLGLALIPGAPLLFLGQLWVIGLLGCRAQAVRGSWRAKISTQMLAQRNPRRFFFPDLPKAFAYALLGLFAAAWLAAMTAPTGYGVPGAGAGRCPWPLNDHGIITCVSHATYDRAGAAGERFACSILFSFFAIHFGVVANEIFRRRQNASAPNGNLA